MGVVVGNRQTRVSVDRRGLARAAGRALADTGRPAGTVDVAVVDDREIRRLNRAYRGVPRRTDVLAFPLETPGAAGRLLGQIVISAETAARHARRLRVPCALEMELLVTHGVLHLVGYDDRDPVEAILMHRRARGLLQRPGRRIPTRLWSGLLHSGKRDRGASRLRRGVTSAGGLGGPG
jgi:probable rRNA maturation factor